MYKIFELIITCFCIVKLYYGVQDKLVYKKTVLKSLYHII